MEAIGVLKYELEAAGVKVVINVDADDFVQSVTLTNTHDRLRLGGRVQIRSSGQEFSGTLNAKSGTRTFPVPGAFRTIKGADCNASMWLEE